MKFETIAPKGARDITVILVDKDYTGNDSVECLIESGDLDTSKAGNTYFEFAYDKNLFITIGDDGFDTSTGNIDKVASAVVSYMEETKNDEVTFFVDQMDSNIVHDIAVALVVADYKFTLDNEESERIVTFITSDDIFETVSEAKIIGDSINMTRWLGDLPANHCTPTKLADFAKSLNNHELNVFTKKEPEIIDMGMGGFASVSRGSLELGQMIVMEYAGDGRANAPTIALVGKAVTFDSGGISIKPSAKMNEMKYDMCGGATVIGVMNAISRLKLPVNVIGLVGAVENMPSGNATKPGDVITTMSGKTVEVLNTDAEGRLVLCDLLTYVGEKYLAHTVIDFATLTGAICVALGDHAAGVFTEDDMLASQLYEAGQAVNDKCWRMPMWKEYDDQLKSDFADVPNIGSSGAGSSTAACFLNRFASDYDYKWAHVDIAGVAWKKSATGRPVKMVLKYLTEYVIDEE